VFGQRRRAEGVESLFELLVRAVEKETQRAATARCVVNHLGHEAFVIAEIELVADADFTGRLHEHVPEFMLGIKLTQQEHLDFGVRAFLVAIKLGRKHFGVVEHHYVAVAKVIYNLLENAMFDFAAFAMKHHQARLVALGQRILCDEFLGQVEVKLTQFHCFFILF